MDITSDNFALGMHATLVGIAKKCIPRWEAFASSESWILSIDSIRLRFRLHQLTRSQPSTENGEEELIWILVLS